MSDLTLSDTLRRLAQLLSSNAGRIRIITSKRTYGMQEDSDSLYLVLQGRMSRMATLTPTKYADNLEDYVMWIEYTLREECLARGWTISMEIRPGTQPSRHCVVLYTPNFFSAHADTPAHALGLALLAALSDSDK